jgi:hypothetical protein
VPKGAHDSGGGSILETRTIGVCRSDLVVVVVGRFTCSLEFTSRPCLDPRSSDKIAAAPGPSVSPHSSFRVGFAFFFSTSVHRTGVQKVFLTLRTYWVHDLWLLEKASDFTFVRSAALLRYFQGPSL